MVRHITCFPGDYPRQVEAMVIYDKIRRKLVFANDNINFLWTTVVHSLQLSFHAKAVCFADDVDWTDFRSSFLEFEAFHVILSSLH